MILKKKTKKVSFKKLQCSLSNFHILYKEKECLVLRRPYKKKQSGGDIIDFIL